MLQFKNLMAMKHNMNNNSSLTQELNVDRKTLVRKTADKKMSENRIKITTPTYNQRQSDRFIDKNILKDFAETVIRNTKYDNKIVGNTFFDDHQPEFDGWKYITK